MPNITVPDDDSTAESATGSKPSTNDQVKSFRFNLDKMREAASQYSASGGLQGEEDLVTVPVYCPPPSSEFVRVRDNDDYWVECMTLDYAPEKGRRGTYYIDSDLMDVLPPEIQSEIKWSRLYTAVIRRGQVPFLWRIKIYDSGPGELSTKTALACVEKAKHLWVRVSWKDRKGYAPFRAVGDYGEPQWPEHTFDELLELAFPDHLYIDSLDHAAVRDLMGQDV
jgi:hypothetical protein